MKNSNALSLVLVVGIMVVVGCSCPRLNELRQGSTDSSNRTVSGTPATGDSDNKTGDSKSTALTMEKYNQIKNGMTYKQVVEIIGSEGTETMSSGEGKYKVTSYKWEGDNFQFITTVFMGDKLTSKVQANLK
jgi:hypothetical protein